MEVVASCLFMYLHVTEIWDVRLTSKFTRRCVRESMGLRRGVWQRPSDGEAHQWLQRISELRVNVAAVHMLVRLPRVQLLMALSLSAMWERETITDTVLAEKSESNKLILKFYREKVLILD